MQRAALALSDKLHALQRWRTRPKTPPLDKPPIREKFFKQRLYRPGHVQVRTVFPSLHKRRHKGKVDPREALAEIAVVREYDETVNSRTYTVRTEDLPIPPTKLVPLPKIPKNPELWEHVRAAEGDSIFWEKGVDYRRLTRRELKAAIKARGMAPIGRRRQLVEQLLSWAKTEQRSQVIDMVADADRWLEDLEEHDGVFAFGNGAKGQLGTGSLDSHATPQPIHELFARRIRDVRVSFESECTFAISTEGFLYAWGAGGDFSLATRPADYRHEGSSAVVPKSAFMRQQGGWEDGESFKGFGSTFVPPVKFVSEMRRERSGLASDDHGPHSYGPGDEKYVGWQEAEKVKAGKGSIKLATMMMNALTEQRTAAVGETSPKAKARLGAAARGFDDATLIIDSSGRGHAGGGSVKAVAAPGDGAAAAAAAAGSAVYAAPIAPAAAGSAGVANKYSIPEGDEDRADLSTNSGSDGDSGGSEAPLLRNAMPLAGPAFASFLPPQSSAFAPKPKRRRRRKQGKAPTSASSSEWFFGAGVDALGGALSPSTYGESGSSAVAFSPTKDRKATPLLGGGMAYAPSSSESSAAAVGRSAAAGAARKNDVSPPRRDSGDAVAIEEAKAEPIGGVHGAASPVAAADATSPGVTATTVLSPQGSAFTGGSYADDGADEHKGGDRRASVHFDDDGNAGGGGGGGGAHLKSAGRSSHGTDEASGFGGGGDDSSEGGGGARARLDDGVDGFHRNALDQFWFNAGGGGEGVDDGDQTALNRQRDLFGVPREEYSRVTWGWDADLEDKDGLWRGVTPGMARVYNTHAKNATEPRPPTPTNSARLGARQAKAPLPRRPHWSRPRRVAGLEGLRVLSVTAGRKHAAIVTSRQELFTWGVGAHGQLGLGDSLEDKDQPTRATPLDHQLNELPVAAAFAGSQHTIALTPEGSLLVFGSAMDGRLGLGPTAFRRYGVTGLKVHAYSTPTRLLHSPLSGVKVDEIACGSTHTLALSQGALWAWGDGGMGRCGWGDGDTRQRDSPQRVPAFVGKVVLRIACAKWHSMAIVQRRADAIAAEHRRPRHRERERAAISGEEEDHDDPRARGGDLYVWGAGSMGQLGLGSVLRQDTPRRLDSLAAVGSIVWASCGLFHSAAVTHGGRLFSWGRTADGRLGRPTTDDLEMDPHPGRVRVNDSLGNKRRVTRIECGLDFSIILVRPRFQAPPTLVARKRRHNGGTKQRRYRHTVISKSGPQGQERVSHADAAADATAVIVAKTPTVSERRQRRESLRAGEPLVGTTGAQDGTVIHSAEGAKAIAEAAGSAGAPPTPESAAGESGVPPGGDSERGTGKADATGAATLAPAGGASPARLSAGKSPPRRPPPVPPPPSAFKAVNTRSGVVTARTASARTNPDSSRYGIGPGKHGLGKKQLTVDTTFAGTGGSMHKGGSARDGDAMSESTGIQDDARPRVTREAVPDLESDSTLTDGSSYVYTASRGSYTSGGSYSVSTHFSSEHSSTDTSEYSDTEAAATVIDGVASASASGVAGTQFPRAVSAAPLPASPVAARALAPAASPHGSTLTGRTAGTAHTGHTGHTGGGDTVVSTGLSYTAPPYKLPEGTTPQPKPRNHRGRQFKEAEARKLAGLERSPSPPRITIDKDTGEETVVHVPTLPIFEGKIGAMPPPPEGAAGHDALVLAAELSDKRRAEIAPALRRTVIKAEEDATVVTKTDMFVPRQVEDVEAEARFQAMVHHTVTPMCGKCNRCPGFKPDDATVWVCKCEHHKKDHDVKLGFEDTVLRFIAEIEFEVGMRHLYDGKDEDLLLKHTLVIQSKWRGRVSRQRSWELICKRMHKLYHDGEEKFFYTNVRTGQSTWKRPHFVKFYPHEDLPAAVADLRRYAEVQRRREEDAIIESNVVQKVPAVDGRMKEVYQKLLLGILEDEYFTAEDAAYDRRALWKKSAPEQRAEMVAFTSFQHADRGRTGSINRSDLMWGMDFFDVEFSKEHLDVAVALLQKVRRLYWRLSPRTLKAIRPFNTFNKDLDMGVHPATARYVDSFPYGIMPDVPNDIDIATWRAWLRARDTVPVPFVMRQKLKLARSKIARARTAAAKAVEKLRKDPENEEAKEAALKAKEEARAKRKKKNKRKKKGKRGKRKSRRTDDGDSSSAGGSTSGYTSRTSRSGRTSRTSATDDDDEGGTTQRSEGATTEGADTARSGSTAADDSKGKGKTKSKGKKKMKKKKPLSRGISGWFFGGGGGAAAAASDSEAEGDSSKEKDRKFNLISSGSLRGLVSKGDGSVKQPAVAPADTTTTTTKKKTPGLLTRMFTSKSLKLKSSGVGGGDDAASGSEVATTARSEDDARSGTNTQRSGEAGSASGADEGSASSTARGGADETKGDDGASATLGGEGVGEGKGDDGGHSSDDRDGDAGAEADGDDEADDHGADAEDDVEEVVDVMSLPVEQRAPALKRQLEAQITHQELVAVFEAIGGASVSSAKCRITGLYFGHLLEEVRIPLLEDEMRRTLVRLHVDDQLLNGVDAEGGGVPMAVVAAGDSDDDASEIEVGSVISMGDGSAVGSGVGSAARSAGAGSGGGGGAGSARITARSAASAVESLYSALEKGSLINPDGSVNQRRDSAAKHGSAAPGSAATGSASGAGSGAGGSIADVDDASSVDDDEPLDEDTLSFGFETFERWFYAPAPTPPETEAGTIPVPFDPSSDVSSGHHFRLRTKLEELRLHLTGEEYKKKMSLTYPGGFQHVRVAKLKQLWAEGVRIREQFREERPPVASCKRCNRGFGLKRDLLAHTRGHVCVKRDYAQLHQAYIRGGDRRAGNTDDYAGGWQSDDSVMSKSDDDHVHFLFNDEDSSEEDDELPL